MTEEDTFRILKKPSHSEMTDIYNEWFRLPEILKIFKYNYSEFCKLREPLFNRYCWTWDTYIDYYSNATIPR